MLQLLVIVTPRAYEQVFLVFAATCEDANRQRADKEDKKQIDFFHEYSVLLVMNNLLLFSYDAMRVAQRFIFATSLPHLAM